MLLNSSELSGSIEMFSEPGKGSTIQIGTIDAGDHQDFTGRMSRRCLCDTYSIDQENLRVRLKIKTVQRKQVIVVRRNNPYSTWQNACFGQTEMKMIYYQ